MTTRNITDPRQLVRTVDLSDLVIAFASGSRHPFAVLTVEGELRFVCPRCGHVDHGFGGLRPFAGLAAL